VARLAAKAALRPCRALLMASASMSASCPSACALHVLPGQRAALLGRSSCFWGSNRSISVELRACRRKLIWADLTRSPV
jgi:hypothetical protein